MSVKEDIRKRVSDGVNELKSLRDEIKLKIHLGGMEARTRWQQFEPKIGQIEREIEQVGDGAVKAAGEMLDETRSAFKKLLDDLKGKGKKDE